MFSLLGLTFHSKFHWINMSTNVEPPPGNEIFGRGAMSLDFGEASRKSSCQIFEFNDISERATLEEENVFLVHKTFLT